MDRIERWADMFRQVADNCGGCGPEVAAIALLQSIAHPDMSSTDQERVQGLRDVLAALDIVNKEKLG